MLLTLTSLALAADTPAWTVTVDPLTTALGYVHLQVEHTLSPHWSLYAGPHARLFDGILTPTPEPFRGYGVESGVRYFFKPGAPLGGWVMGRGVVARLNTTEDSDLVKVGGYGSALVGYTHLAWGWLVLSGGAGVNYLDYNIAGYGVSGPFLALHTTIGVGS